VLTSAAAPRRRGCSLSGTTRISVSPASRRSACSRSASRTAEANRSQAKKLPAAGADPASYQYFDRTAFAAVNIPTGQQQRFGNSPRNPIRGPGFWNADLGLFKSIGLPRSARLQIRVEVLNALNHPNFANPGADISNAGAFGFITGTTGTGERTIRLGARLSF
jgi:hypothetical protein